MDINIESVGFRANQKLLDFIEKKLQKLTKFHHRIVSADVKLRLEKEDSRENKVADVFLKVPQTELLAKRNSATFEESVDLVIDALRQQLKKHKEKMIDR